MDLLTFLITEGSDLNKPNEGNLTPMRLAADKGEDFLKVLIDAGAKVDAVNLCN